MSEEQTQKLEFAEERLDTAKFLFRNEMYQDAISRSYYSIFHSAKALLLEKDSDPKTHTGTASELGQLYRKELGKEMTREFSRIQEKRERADYGELTEITKKETEEIIKSSEEFISKTKEIINQS